MMDYLNKWVKNLKDKVIDLRLEMAAKEEPSDIKPEVAAEEPQIDFAVQESTETPTISSIESGQVNMDLSAERIWDLSELDSELAENVFMGGDTEKSEDTDSSDPVSSDSNDMSLVTEESSSDPINGENSGNIEIPNIQRVTVASEQPVDNEETVAIHSVEQDSGEQDDSQDGHDNGADEEKGVDDDLFSDAVKVRPYVKKLLESHGKIQARDLLEEMKSVATMMKAQEE